MLAYYGEIARNATVFMILNSINRVSVKTEHLKCDYAVYV